jgi:tetratricopeptide (TPR) repeat protein
VAFSPDNQLLATASADKTVHLWALSDSTAEPRLLRGHAGRVYGVAFSPDGQLLATASADKTVRLWALGDSTAEPRLLRLLQGHADTVYGVAFSRDGQLLATASADKTVRLWALGDSTAEPRLLRGHAGTVYGVAFSPGGQWLATASADNTTRLWTLGIKDLIKKGCRLAAGNFSQEDWKSYLYDEHYNRTCWEHPIHPSFLNESSLKDIRDEVKSGNVEGGVANFYKALQEYGASDVNLQKEARRLAATALVDKGQELARAGEVDGAVDVFKQARDLDSTLTLDPRVEAWRLAATALVDKGQELARAGEVDGAVDVFKQARDLDSTLTLDPGTEARHLAAEALVNKGRELARQGDIKQAIGNFSAAQEIDPNLEIDAHSWNYLCWFGSLGGFATDVLTACEKAVALAPDDGGNVDSRGLARALTGDYPGAVEDFRQYLDWGPKNGQPEERIRQRQDWIRTLQANQNPFNPEVLQLLWQQ